MFLFILSKKMGNDQALQAKLTLNWRVKIHEYETLFGTSCLHYLFIIIHNIISKLIFIF